MCKLRVHFNFCLLLGRWKHWKYFHICYVSAIICNLVPSPTECFNLHEWGHPNIYSVTLDHSVCSKTAQALLTHPFVVWNHQPTNQPMCEGLCDNSFHSRPPFQTLGNQQLVSVSSPHHISPHNVCRGSNGQSNTRVAYHKRRESEGQNRLCRMKMCFKVV